LGDPAVLSLAFARGDLTAGGETLRTKPISVRWLDLHNLGWKLELEQESPQMST
jgi:hypothetical protein